MSACEKAELFEGFDFGLVSEGCAIRYCRTFDFVLHGTKLLGINTGSTSFFFNCLDKKKPNRVKSQLSVGSRTAIYVSSYHYVCDFKPLYMCHHAVYVCPHTTIYVSSCH